MKTDNKLPVYTLTIENIDFDGIQGISIVEEPAIEEYFMKFSKVEKINFTETKSNEEKKIITGPALIPDKLIYRRVNGNKFNVKFERDVIEEIRNKFLINFKQKNINLNHAVNANNVSVVESWIIEDNKNDKANVLGFDLPKGTWMVSMKIDNDIVWESIKDGDLKGFSIEAWLTSNLVDEDFNKVEDVEAILSSIEDFIEKNEISKEEAEELQQYVKELNEIL